MTPMTRSLSRLAAGAIALAAAVAHAAPVTPRFEHAISNLPGKTLVSVEVSFAPGEVSSLSDDFARPYRGEVRRG